MQLGGGGASKRWIRGKSNQSITAWRMQAESVIAAPVGLCDVSLRWKNHISHSDPVLNQAFSWPSVRPQFVDRRLTGVWTCANTVLAPPGQKFGLNTCMFNIPVFFIVSHNPCRGTFDVLTVHIELVNRDEFEAFYGDTNDAVWAAPAS